jgi:hypothetical protein
MRRVKRRVFNVIAAASLALWLLTSAAFWARSYYGSKSFPFQCDGAMAVQSWHGRLILSSVELRNFLGDEPMSTHIDSPGGELIYPEVEQITWARVKKMPNTLLVGRQQFDFAPGVWRNGYGFERHGWFLGMAKSRTRGDRFILAWAWVMPYWIVAAAPLITSLALLYRRQARIRKKRDPRSCQLCGYDLRATPERCPECGAIPAKLEAKA